MNRPKGVEITTWLIGLALVAEVIQIFIRWNWTLGLYPTRDISLQQAVLYQREFSVLMVLVSLVALYFYRQGREIARRIVILDCTICLLFLLRLNQIWKLSRITDAAIIFQDVLAAFLLFYLFRPAVRAWFLETTKATTISRPTSGTNAKPFVSDIDPQFLQRPVGIQITTVLMVLSLLLEIVAGAINWNSVVGIHPTGKATIESIQLFKHITIVLSVALQIAILVFYWKGRNWARIFVLLGCAGYFYSLLKIRLFWQASHFNGVSLVLNVLLSVFLLAYLFTPSIRAWFTARTAQAYRIQKPQPA